MPQGMSEDSLPASSDLPGWRTRIFHLIKGRSLAECVDSGRDNILQLRLMAALMVVLGHSNIGGPGKWRYDPVSYVLPQIQVHPVGLMMFFMISGFLITLSYLRRPDLPRFLVARVLRIWPAFLVCAVVLAFVLGPLLTTVPLRQYFATPWPAGPFRYAWNGIAFFSLLNALPGVFLTNPVVPGQINTPLWTISLEATMYLWVAGAGTLRLLKFPWLTSIAIAAVFSVLVLWPLSKGIYDYRLTVQGFFGAGAMACLLRRHVPISTGLMIAIAIACLFARHTIHALPFIWLTVGYFVLWFAYVPRLPSIPHDLDLSYGTYLWAWPIQQSVVFVCGVHEPLVLFAIVVPIVLTVATVSWLCIEKPALRLKKLRWKWRKRVPSSSASDVQDAVP